MQFLAAEVYKTIVLGPPNVGKSSLIRRFSIGEFSDSYRATVGVDMNATTLDFPGGRVILTVVDIGGQETFSALRGRFFAGAHHMILVFDKTKRSTFDVIPEWYDKLTGQFDIAGHRFLNGSLVGNKADMEGEAEVTTKEAERLANVLTLKYFDTSAKTGQNVAELFLHAAESSRQFAKRSQ